MKKIICVVVSILTATLLEGCGGDGNMSLANQAGIVQKTLTPRSKAVATDYAYVVQELYVSYFGRPADPQGLAFYETSLLNAGAPTDIQNLNIAYSTNPSIKALVDGFGNSAESNTLYGSGDAGALVSAIFQHVLGRPPLPTGLSSWSSAIAGGTITRSDAALSIMAAAEANTTPQGLLDAALIANRIAVASNFTAALSTPGAIFSYSGAAAASSVRTMLATVDSNTSVSAFQPTVSAAVSTLASLKFTAIQAIITQRCVPCHSSHPVEPGFSPAPDGVMLDTAAEIGQDAALINSYAVQQQIMPYGNITGMTSSERSMIGSWYQAGAFQ